MKRILAIAAFLLLATAGARAQQTQTTFSITVQAPPSCTATLAPNPASTSGSKLYSGQAGVINFNISACSIASASATATWDGTATPTNFVVSPAALSVPITAAQATVGSHSLVLTIPWPQLTMANPVQLPNAQVGVSYSASLSTLTGLSGGVPPYTWTLTSGSLPNGLSLSADGSVTGTPSGAGSFNFGFAVSDSSGLSLFVRPSKYIPA